MQINLVNNTHSNPNFGNSKVKRLGTKAYDLFSTAKTSLFSKAKAGYSKGADVFVNKKSTIVARDPELRSGPLPWHGKK